MFDDIDEIIHDDMDEHIPLIVGIVLFVVTYIVGSIFSPWSMDTTWVTRLVYFGIMDVEELILYVQHTYDSMPILFLSIMAIGALFYMQIIVKVILDKLDIDNPTEKSICDFLFGNIGAYISCVICYHALPYANNLCSNEETSLAVRIVFFCAIVLTAFLSLYVILYLLAYEVIVGIIIKIGDKIISSVSSAILQGVLLVVTILIVTIIGIIITVAMDKLYDEIVSIFHKEN